MSEQFDLVAALKTGAREVTFTKADGTTRVMKATLSEQYVDGDVPAQPLNNGTVTAWDIDAKNWRSFRMESVQSTRQLLTE